MINIDREILNSFHNLFDTEENFKNYVVYYQSLVNWVNEKSEWFTVDLKKSSRLDVLLTLDPQQYVVENPELSLNLEKRRIGLREYETIDDLAMTIGDTLWDLVTIRSGKDCPNCQYDELRYVLAIDKTSKKSILTLECESCGWSEDIMGNAWSGGICDVYPARKDDINGYKFD